MKFQNYEVHLKRHHPEEDAKNLRTKSDHSIQSLFQGSKIKRPVSHYSPDTHPLKKFASDYNENSTDDLEELNDQNENPVQTEFDPSDSQQIVSGNLVQDGDLLHADQEVAGLPTLQVTSDIDLGLVGLMDREDRQQAGNFVADDKSADDHLPRGVPGLAVGEGDSGAGGSRDREEEQARYSKQSCQKTGSSCQVR